MGRTILLTGASSGIGRAIGLDLLATGHTVVGLARDPSRFPAGHAAFHPCPVDLADLDALPRRLGEIAADHPTVDALICNAGRGLFGHLEQFSYAQIRTALDLNFTSHVLTVRAFLPQLKQRHRGDIVFTGSEAALQGARQGGLYCAAKFALRGLAQALRAECAPAGIRVTLVNPGLVRTPFFDELDFAPGPESDHAIAPEDVAQAVRLALEARPGTVIDEINLSPQKHVLSKKAKGKTQ
ncbi:MAG: SDR family NAD(P)-dependent oxidoreductase [Candidatus Latescibacteria bacterium]|nr:SDR family NAD(P)-dependent oxidoreductase [Candidatus Latescibacterota bacterium]